MNIELIKKWVEALESGDYKQTSGRLCEEIEGTKHYCCIGVLAEVAGIPAARENETNPHGRKHVFIFKFPDVDYNEVGGATTSWWNTITGGEIGMQDSYWHMNDSEGKSFAEIAAEIRKRITL